MSISLRSFIASDGERFSQLYNSHAGGFPLFYPTAYVAHTLRTDHAHETQKVYLEAIKRVCEWEYNNQLDLDIRFQKQEFLKPMEIASLVKHLAKKRNGVTGETIGSSKRNTYIAYAADYLLWLAEHVITDPSPLHIRSKIDKQNADMLKKIERKTGSKSAKRQRILASKLPQHTSDQLESLFNDPFVDLQREADKASRLRNIVMVRILYETGMRRGELLSLKLKNIQESIDKENGTLTIERNHHDEFDNRIRQPVAKSLGRVVPISLELETQLLQYIQEHRAQVPGVDFSAESFIFVNHRAVRSQGCPIKDTAFHSSLKHLKSIFPALNSLHPHLLRHDWNYRFSVEADKDGLKPVEERELREYLMGWAPESSMSLIYNQRHIQSKANEFGLKIAHGTIRK
ncbi:site-specific integrase [Pseudomonas alcaligenes]|uniref:site-specific integrase n=1 Tax=Pseudomonadaceae TaxID=135621 RepID=UPI002E7BB74B|nr:MULTISPECIES: site-specific integrase [Pseudomonas]MEE1895104.1 site-specific integrase [Pseudomonas otitidis]MEE1949912.1 site-specific integrase [Pseudomonas alcaligenes]HDL5329825.1 site-specific integrase [Pseudomonas aeruginosa]